MAEHTLQTNPPSNGVIMQLRYDTYTRWMASDLILKKGEAAIAVFPNSNPLSPPTAVGIKIGDGRSYFDELPWVQAIASDVYEWAKASEKPTYNANEIIGLATYIAEHTSGGGSGGTGAGQYRIVYDSNTAHYILQQFNESSQEWEDTSSIIDLSTVLNRINTIERWANGARTQLGNIEAPLASYVYEELVNYLDTLDVRDEPVEGQFVTAVLQNNGAILVQRAPINLSEIQTGTLGTEHGGTGLTQVFEDQVLVGSVDGSITTRTFVTEIDIDRNAFATVGAIKDYVAAQTAGLTGAMHFIGETQVAITQGSTADPQIPGYTFRNALAGDVILYNTQEFVWNGSNWYLLGDEGSYAVKGSIVNADIAENASIAQYKINGLVDALENKVDKIEGKQLSTNDYSDEEKLKLSHIEDDAQVNIIEHFFLNDEEILPTTVSRLPKSIDMHFNGMSREQSEKLDTIEEGAQVNLIEHIKLNNVEIQPDNNKTVNIELVEYTNEEKEKLATIEEGAQVNQINSIIMDGETQTPDEDGVVTLNSNPHTEHINRIEHIFVNGTELVPTTINNETKSVDITVDESALTFQILKGARYPTGPNTYADVEIDTTTKKLEVSRIAATGDVQHLLQTQNTYITLDCGTSNSDTHPAVS